MRLLRGGEQLAVLRVLANRRRSLGGDNTRMVSQLHRVLFELMHEQHTRSAAVADVPAARLRRDR